MDYFRCGQRQGADEVAFVVGHAKIERVARVVDAAPGVLTVNLIAEEVELARGEFDDEWTFG